jgi:hypothetical protein
MFRYWAAWIKSNMLDYLSINPQQQILPQDNCNNTNNCNELETLNNANVAVFCIFSEFTLLKLIHAKTDSVL